MNESFATVKMLIASDLRSQWGREGGAGGGADGGRGREQRKLPKQTHPP